MPTKKATTEVVEESSPETDAVSEKTSMPAVIAPPVSMNAEVSAATAARKRSLELGQIPARWANPPSELISKLPKGGAQLDYMGHADVTLALIQIDPSFEYGWLTKEDGSMMVNKVGDLFVLEGWLTVLGHTRRGVGTCESRKNEVHKELIGDLLRNCAMRFGVATTLWSKAERHEWGVPQDPSAARVFDMLRQETAALDADQRRSLREWWISKYGDTPVSADAGFEKIIDAIAHVRTMTVAVVEEVSQVTEEPSAVDALVEAFPGAELVEHSE